MPWIVLLSYSSSSISRSTRTRMMLVPQYRHVATEHDVTRVWAGEQGLGVFCDPVLILSVFYGGGSRMIDTRSRDP
jgi:hypothetical protein